MINLKLSKNHIVLVIMDNLILLYYVLSKRNKYVAIDFVLSLT